MPDTLHPHPNRPRVSVIIPTLNAAATLETCLASIRAQRGPFEIEIVIADAGSADDTVAIAKRYDVDRIVDNPLKTGEAGKSAGIGASTGAFIALIDSDNILESESWMSQMLAPFSDPDIIASEPLRYTRRDEDPALTRYFAMLGMNDPVCLFFGNYDRECMISDRWTGLEIESTLRDGYTKLTLRDDEMPTIGANGFIIRRTVLEHITWEPYWFDIDIAHETVTAGFPYFAKVDCGIVHLYCRDLRGFARKQTRRIRDFLHFSGDGRRTFPWSSRRRRGTILFCLATVTVLPLLIQMIRGYCRKPDAAWAYHLPVCFVTLYIYGVGSLRKALGGQQGEMERTGWKQDG